MRITVRIQKILCALMLVLTATSLWAADDVDTRIPVTTTVNDKTFALIISNENYKHEVAVPFALNDGEMFAVYCEKAFGLPQKNIHRVSDATLNDMKHELQWLKGVMNAYAGEARAIVYYSGHGMPDEKSKEAILLPVDGYASDPSSGLSTKTFYADLASMPSMGTMVFLDACFSGAKREGGMMVEARGVAIKAKRNEVSGPVVVFSAAQGDETAFPLKNKQHGLFTYYVLEKIQQSKGAVKLGELSDYVTKHVSQSSMVDNGKSQTPSTASAVQGWREWQLVNKPATDYETRQALTPKTKEFVVERNNTSASVSRPAVTPVQPSHSGAKVDVGNYQIEGAGTGVQGTYLVKVTLTAKKPTVSAEQLCRCAVHGVLFRGFTGNRQRQRPLAGSPENESLYSEFYTDFLHGDLQSYAQAQSDSRLVTKVGKEYKVSMLISVYKDQLRRDLESRGVIRSLSNGF